MPGRCVQSAGEWSKRMSPAPNVKAASAAVSVKTLKIDGRDLSATPDQSILDVARENNIFIPRLCELNGLSTVGACRLCLVEVKGTNKLLPSCVTRVEEGMEVTTSSPRLLG